MAKIPDMDDYFDRLEKCAKWVDERSIEYGYPTREKHDPDGLPIAEIADRNENGIARPTGGWIQPPRRFMTKAGLLADSLTDEDIIVNNVVEGRIAATKASYQALAKRCADLIREAILYGHYAPLSPITVALKGHNTPLIDTEQMYEAATYKIVKKKEAK